MTLKHKALQIIIFLFVSSGVFGQKVGNISQKKDSTSVFSKKHNTWALGLGLNNLIMHGDFRSLGTGDQGNYWNFGSYLYIDKMFNPVLGVEFKIDYSKLGGASQYFSNGYKIKYLEDSSYEGLDLILEGYKYGFEVDGIINLTNLWKLNSNKWSLSFMAGMGYHRYTSKLLSANDAIIDGIPTPAGSIILNFENNLGRDNNDHASSIFLNTSLSLKRRLGKHFDIELRPTLNLNNEDHFDAAISDKQIYETFFTTHLGIVYKFGSKDKYAIWVNDEDIVDESKFEIVDTDDDGVMDELDKEPETPKEAEVYGSGIAIDTDKDGIPDYKDRCHLIPGTEANEGCPEDKDGDGIFDIDDVCPEIRGTIEYLGCPKDDTSDDVTKRIFLLSKSIYFKTDSDIIKGDSYSILNEIANIMLEYPKTQFKIDGHTDDRAPAYYNMNLSERRATSVLSYLTNKGVNTYRLYSEGFGEENPTHSNNTEQGRKFNRRVEINFIQPDSEQGAEIYTEGTDITESVNIIQPQTAGMMKDSDGDGVADLFDKELNTPKGALVYGNGVSLDTDKDGIPDYSDDCPLLFGIKGKNGCPAILEGVTSNGDNVTITDTDGDGVIDVLDAEKNTPKGAKVYGNGIAIDTDNDGIIDLNDKCPLQPGATASNGCPDTNNKNTNTKATLTISDKDGDGVIDELDIENDTPAGSKVYGNGVAIDTDNDGVIDLIDNCPLKVGKADNNGCPLKTELTATGSVSMDDADGDGVIDSLDQEPNTPLEAKVYGNGVAVDTDGDGVADYKDNCPLKYGAADKQGCPHSEDTDGDGVVNEYDKEPNTPFGVKVYGNGVSMDTDSDGTPDHKDACPLKPGENSNGGCPKVIEEDATGNVSLIDSDGDGVVDQFDDEPNTPSNAKVYGNGVSMDTDNDGVPDYKDACPLKAGTIEKEGCPEIIEEDATGNVSLIDSDGDGVVDQFDAEPNTPSNAKVHGNGVSIDTDYDGIPDHSDKCPIKPGTKENDGCPTEEDENTQLQLLDTDNDGVIDLFDRDPNTPEGALVYGNGIPIDSDRDGLPDYKDKCPLKAGPVEKEGCPEEERQFDWEDTDGDGVVNEFDKEPNTPTNAKVYGNGVSLDSDYDDVPDHSDECPFKAGPVENKGCPKIEGAIDANVKDTDKDGVIDLYDKEPNTPFGVKVYSNGVSIDSDKDKVPDYKDRCPLVKGLVENEGCPIGEDLDGDGILDSEDLCPDVKGTAANNGCPDKNFDKSVSLKVEALARKIIFERTKNTLTNETNEILDEVLKIMKDYPATQYQIAAHTDNKHNEKYSLFLSKRRANAIMKYLIDGGIDEDRLTAEGYGDTSPKYPNSGDLATSELNNRIEFNFVLPE